MRGSFQYPDTWRNKLFGFSRAPDPEDEILATLGDDNASIGSVLSNITKHPDLSFFNNGTVESVASGDYSSLAGLSFNRSSYNNITFYEMIYTTQMQLLINIQKL